MTKDELKAAVRTYVAEQFLPGESPDLITDATLLVSDGIIDSLGSLRLVSWLEERFGVAIEANEVTVDHLDTLDLIAELVLSKRS
jgi:acyl carrier protein